MKNFREQSTIVMKTFFNENYNLKNVEKRRKSQEYAQNIIRLKKSTQLLVYVMMLFERVISR